MTKELSQRFSDHLLSKPSPQREWHSRFHVKPSWREGTDTKQEVSCETRLASRVNKPEVHFDERAAEHEPHKEERGQTARFFKQAAEKTKQERKQKH